MKEKQVVIANQLVNYLMNDSEDPVREAVVFLHGWRSEGKMWIPIMERLLRDYARDDNSLRVFALDLPGFGKSEKPKHTFDLANYALIVRGFIEKLQLKKVNLVGHSFGGRVAIKLSATEPDLIKKLVLVDSAGYNFQKGRNKFYKFLAKIFKPVFMLPGMSSLRENIYEMLGAEDYLATPELKETFINIINEDLTALLRYIRQETLIIWGGHDNVTPLVMGVWLKENIRRSDLIVYNDAGHFSFLDEPKKFVESLRDFLKDHYV